MQTTAGPSPWNWDNSYSELPSPCYTQVDPSPVKRPSLVTFNQQLAHALGLKELSTIAPDTLALFLSGIQLWPGSKPLAMAYAGHQYGNFVVLGDGRAILLGEHIAPDGTRHDIQLKGSGRTPYSRGGDGRAALGPMLREYLMSEAMAALGIPTTRSLAVIRTGETVFRNEPLPGAILVRTAASHLRVGTFALFAALQDEVSLRALLDYTIARHYPQLSDAPNRAIALLETVQQQQAQLVANWMAVGFVHGVLNSDNVALSGETIDYGPCAFIDRYDPAVVYSSIDSRGRYAYTNQPAITAWNLARFAESLLSLIDPVTNKAVQLAEQTLANFGTLYSHAYLAKMRPKFGISDTKENDSQLIEDWLSLLAKHRVDYTNAFRALSGDDVGEQATLNHPEFSNWLNRLEQRLVAANQPQTMIQQLRDEHNPRHIPRNHAVQKALDAAENGDTAPFEEALCILRQPFKPAANRLFAATPSPADQVFTSFCGT